jgi:hypothetical protein
MVTEKEVKAQPSDFYKFLFCRPLLHIYGICIRKLDSMKDWKQLIYDIYAPQFGVIWAVPNGISIKDCKYFIQELENVGNMGL